MLSSLALTNSSIGTDHMAIFELIVGNVGKVWEGDASGMANKKFADYVALSKEKFGRCAGECVDLYQEGEILDQYIPIMFFYEECKCPDCGKNIPNNMEDGGSCKNCGHVFTYQTKTDDFE